MPKKKTSSPPPVDLPAEKKEPSELELLESEMKEISPRLADLKWNNSEEYEKVYKHYMSLVLRRDEILRSQS